MADFVQKEKYTGEFNGQTVSFNREWSGHKFTDAECEALLAGSEIIIEAVSKKTGNKFSVCGKLDQGMYNGKSFYAFQPDFNKKIIPITLNGHVITNKEREALEKGKEILIQDFISKTNNQYAALVTFDEKEGIKLEFQNSRQDEN